MRLHFPDMLPLLVELADRAGEAILEVYGRGSVAVQQKSDCSPLTEADLAANRIICEGLVAHWPAIPVLTEEAANPFAPDDTPPRYWAVDPLDGTREFVKRNGEFTVNIALVESGEPVLGVVFAPVLDALYVGALGNGAQRRVKGHWTAIRSALPGRAPLRVAASRSHKTPALEAWIAGLAQPFERREVGSSLKFCLIAEGEADIYPRFGPTNLWDTAAGHAVLRAAGGRVVTAQGLPLLYLHPGRPLNPDFIALAGGVECGVPAP